MGTGHRVVVVDDDPDIRDLLVHVLEHAGHEVLTADTGQAALDVVRETNPDLVTLDLTLPDLDGTEVCRRIREFTDAYVIMITGRAAEIDRLVGLEVGADDYMSKPFSPREVRARAAALLRRPRTLVGTPAPAAGAGRGATNGRPEPSDGVEVGGGLSLKPVQRTAQLNGEPLSLTPVEVDLLSTLSSEPGRAWQRGDLVRAVWKGDFIESDFLVDVHVASLRRKLRKADSGREWIRAVEGSAYLFDPA